MDSTSKSKKLLKEASEVLTPRGKSYGDFASETMKLAVSFQKLAGGRVSVHFEEFRGALTILGVKWARYRQLIANRMSLSPHDTTTIKQVDKMIDDTIIDILNYVCLTEACREMEQNLSDLSTIELNKQEHKDEV